jgi:hypothetical protein
MARIQQEFISIRTLTLGFRMNHEWFKDAERQQQRQLLTGSLSINPES